MTRHTLFITLAHQRYEIQRDWGDTAGPGGISDVACDKDGRIFVLLRADAYKDPEGPAVIVLSPDGRREGEFGQKEVADGHMLGVSPDGIVHVVDRDAHQIIAFDRHGREQGRIGRRHYAGEPFNSPCDVGFAPNGDIYVADGYAGDRVHVFSPGGTPIRWWGESGTGNGQFIAPHAVWVLADGRVAVADRDNNRVQIFSADGAWLHSITDVFKPMDIWGDAHGNLLISDQVPRLSLYTPEGVLMGRGRAVLNGAHGICITPEGVILTAELNPRRMSRLVPVTS
jgi:DNA-binding beta-propeller fold protein YncE